MVGRRREVAVGHGIGWKNPQKRSRAPQVAQSPEQGAKQAHRPALKAPRGADADPVPPKQPEVAAGDLHE